MILIRLMMTLESRYEAGDPLGRLLADSRNNRGGAAVPSNPQIKGPQWRMRLQPRATAVQLQEGELR